jgi:hypothetical protein
MTTRSPIIAFLATALLIPGTNAAEPGLPAGPRMAGRVSSAFLELDRDGDGRLSFGEWFRSRRGAEAMPSKALGFFRDSDLNRNRRLSSYEFGRSQGIRAPRPNSNPKPGVPGGSTQGATVSTGSSGGSNTTSGIAVGSSLTKGAGTTGGTLVIRGTGGGSSGAVTEFNSTTFSNPGSVNTLTLGSGNLTIGTLNPLTLLTAPGTTDSSGNTILNAGPLSLGGSGTFHVGMLPVGTIQGGTLVISGTFSRYVGLTLEAARQLAESEDRPSRVFSIDGVRQTVTTDQIPSRVNFFLVDGIVKLAIGG